MRRPARLIVFSLLVAVSAASQAGPDTRAGISSAHPAATAAGMEILASRVLLRPADYQKTLTFYRDALGLAIAARVVEVHGGRLELRDPPEGGFSVCLLLPALS